MSRAQALSQLPPPLPRTRPQAPGFSTALKAAQQVPAVAPVAKARLSAVAVLPVAAAVPAQPGVVARARVEAEAGRLTTVRAEHHVQAQALTQTRQGHQEQAHAQVDERALEHMVAELERCLGQAAAEKPSQLPFAVVTPPPPPVQGAEAREPPLPIRALQALALVERIEVFMKEQRPTLALTLNNALACTVELERLAPGTVAVTLKGKQGPPSPEMVSRLRDELRDRGLKLGALSVA